MERKIDLELNLCQAADGLFEVVGVGRGRKQSRGNMKVLAVVAICE